MSIHGAIRALTIAGRGFKVAHDGPGNRMVGGRSNEIVMNGDGTARTIQTVMPGSINDLQIEIDDTKNDQEYIQGIVDAGLPVVVVVTYASGVSYTGDLVITGEPSKDETNGLMTMSFQGGALSQI